MVGENGTQPPSGAGIGLKTAHTRSSGALVRCRRLIPMPHPILQCTHATVSPSPCTQRLSPGTTQTRTNSNPKSTLELSFADVAARTATCARGKMHRATQQRHSLSYRTVPQFTFPAVGRLTLSPTHKDWRLCRDILPSPAAAGWTPVLLAAVGKLTARESANVSRGSIQ